MDDQGKCTVLDDQGKCTVLDDQGKCTVLDVPLLVADEENIKPFGRLCDSFDGENVILTPWPTSSKRPLCQVKWQTDLIRSGLFTYQWTEDDIQISNEAMGLKDYVIGLADNSSTSHVLVREANYHPDSGEVLFSQSRCPFVLMVASPGDDITPHDFRALYFDGTKGVQLFANVWHQPAFTHVDKYIFQHKHGPIHSFVGVDTVEEFGTWLRVPLCNSNMPQLEK